MNDLDIVQKMISFISKKEQEIQANKFNAEPQGKNDAVKSILDKLDQEIGDEDK